jgi:NAD(P)-dependent dehydrogenase (short-subunit alcohol dehydrogenase family)
MSTDGTKVALVTGASRGLGKATALRLARAGFDVAISARTEREGEGRTDQNSVRADSVVAVPGSLETTASEIEALGRRALPVRMDLGDPDSVVATPRAVLDAWGRIDVLVNNAIIGGGASMDRVMDLTASSMTKLFTGNFVHQVLLTQQVIPAMLEQGDGVVVDMVSASARIDPIAPAGQGGWGIGYSASKAAFGRFAGGINAEFGPRIRAYNVDPGSVVTEARKARESGGTKDEFRDHYGSDSPDATAATIAWLATSPDATRLLGKWIYAPKLAEDRGFLT